MQYHELELAEEEEAEFETADEEDDLSLRRWGFSFFRHLLSFFFFIVYFCSCEMR